MNSDHQVAESGIQNKNTKFKKKTISSLELIAAGRKSAGNTFDKITTMVTVPYTR